MEEFFNPELYEGGIHNICEWPNYNIYNIDFLSVSLNIII